MVPRWSGIRLAAGKQQRSGFNRPQRSDAAYAGGNRRPYFYDRELISAKEAGGQDGDRPH
jgi:hypothetical protein